MKKEKKSELCVFVLRRQFVDFFFYLSVPPREHERLPSGCSPWKDSGVIKTGPIV